MIMTIKIFTHVQNDWRFNRCQLPFLLTAYVGQILMTTLYSVSTCVFVTDTGERRRGTRMNYAVVKNTMKNHHKTTGLYELYTRRVHQTLVIIIFGELNIPCTLDHRVPICFNINVMFLFCFCVHSIWSRIIKIIDKYDMSSSLPYRKFDEFLELRESVRSVE